MDFDGTWLERFGEIMDIVLSDEHDKKIKGIEALFAKGVGKGDGKVGYKSEIHRLAIDVLYGMLVEKKSVFKVTLDEVPDQPVVGTILHIGVDYLKVRFVINDKVFLVENVTNFPKVKRG